jgi:hypothetical protein
MLVIDGGGEVHVRVTFTNPHCTGKQEGPTAPLVLKIQISGEFYIEILIKVKVIILS